MDGSEENGVHMSLRRTAVSYKTRRGVSVVRPQDVGLSQIDFLPPTATVMVSYYVALSLCFVSALTSCQGLTYEVINRANWTTGGRLFDEIMGERRAASSMEAATYFIWNRVFRQEKEEERKPVEKISFIIEPTLGNDLARVREIFEGSRYSYEIHLAHHVIESAAPPGFKVEDTVSSALHEDRIVSEINRRLTAGVAFALQWTGWGDLPLLLRFAVAQCAVLEAHGELGSGVKAGEGDRWDESAAVAAQFFYYINQKTFRFVSKWNKLMRYSYRQSYFKMAAGMEAEEWWKRYKEEYSTPTP